MAYCAQCGTPNASGSFYCQKCSAILEFELQTAVAECPECRHPYAALDAFCRGCGAPLVETFEVPQTATEVTPDFLFTGLTSGDAADEPRKEEELPSWLQNYVTETDDTEKPAAEPLADPIWLSDFAELEKSIESSAFLLPDEDDDEQPIDLTAWLKDLDLADEVSALVEQVHGTPAIAHEPETAGNLPDEQTSTALQTPLLENEDDTSVEEVQESPAFESGRLEEPEPATTEKAAPALPEPEPEQPVLVEPEDYGTKFLRDIEEPPAPESESIEVTPEPRPVSAIDTEDQQTGEAPAPIVPDHAEEAGQQTPSSLTIHLQPVALMVPLRPPLPISARTQAGAVFAGIGAPAGAGNVGSQASSLPSAAKKSSRAAWLIGIIVLLVVILAIAYLVLSQVIKIGFGGLITGLAAIPELFDLIGL
jgi:hypothetical protein